MRAVLDTSLLIAEDPALMPEEGAISTASLAELHFGVHAAREPAERARRLARLGAVEAEFAPVPIDAAIARAWGSLAATAAERGLQPRRRAMDLLIAGTALVLSVPLLTLAADLAPLSDVLEIRLLDRR